MVRSTTFILMLLMVGAGCVRLNTPGSRPDAAGLVMVYGRGSSAMHENEQDIMEHWMTVYVTVSDSAYVFGHVGEGDFERYTSNAEGHFRIRGGESRHFALQDTLDLQVYALAKGRFEFAGPAMSAGRAVHPPMEEDYFSIVKLSFEINADSLVTAELVASAPNGFSAGR